MDHVSLTEPWSRDIRDNFFESQFESRPVSQANGTPQQHTKSPAVTGTAVLGLRFKDGTMIAADNLASYGSMARFRDVERLMEINENAMIGVGGDISDYQHLRHILDKLMIRENYQNDGHNLSAKHVATYIANILYQRRSKIDPLWNTVIIAGPEHLSYADLYGTTFESDCIATGLGSYLALPLLRKKCENNRWKELSKEDARKAIDDAMRVLFYRDARSANKFSVATITSDGIEVQKNQVAETEWKFAEGLRGYGAQIA